MSTLLSWFYSLKSFLRGKKTHILGVTGTLLNLALVLDPTLLTPTQLVKLDAIWLLLTGMALRAGISKI